MKATTISAVIELLLAAYPKAGIGPNTGRVYEMTLADIDPVLLQAAVLKHVTSSKWFPTVAELREAAMGLLKDAAGVPSALEAWGIFQRRGMNASPIIRDTVLAVWGSETAARQRLNETIASDRARFCEAYNTLAQRQADRASELPALTAYREHITGLAEKMRLPELSAGGQLDEQEFNRRRDALVAQAAEAVSE